MVHSLAWAEGMKVIPRYTEQEIREWWSFVDWVSQNLPSGTVIAAKDHGRLAYFTDVQVVDLAGIIDPSIETHLRTGDMQSYLDAKGVQYAVLPEEGGMPVFDAIVKNLCLQPISDAPKQEASGYSLVQVCGP
jgi:hypothetical protein